MITLKVGGNSFSIEAGWDAVFEETDFTKSSYENLPSSYYINGVKVSKVEFERAWDEQRIKNPIPDKVEYIYPFLIEYKRLII